MNKTEKNIYLTIIIGLILVIAIGGIYIVTNSSNSKEIESNDKTNNSNDTKDVTLTNNELKDLLSYVPNIHIAADGVSYKKDIAYSMKKATINEISESYLIGNALQKLGNDPYKKYSKSDVETMLKKMYNIENISIKNSGENYVASDGALCYSYNDGYFTGDYCSEGGEHFSSIENYEGTTDELIIYEIVAAPNEYDPIGVMDYYTGKVVKVDLDKTEAYFNNHKNEFTKYKNTFKKNNSGYYWYSTEVVE